MDLDYDQKYEEMKKYIPFLDNMIKKLEDMPSSSGKQSQLHKIRSLRTLLLDMNKRMKMTNLLRCEQVLINLYAKVSKTNLCDGPDFESEADKEKPDLEAIRSKLKCVTMKQEAEADTLPEIARSSDAAEMCTLGSKEPALFQRRPKKKSQSPMRSSSANMREPTLLSPSKSTSRRYTRVLVSPESSTKRWASNEHLDSNKLFSRRSPPRRSPMGRSPASRSFIRRSPRRSPIRRSPRRYSPAYHKKERKKHSKNISRVTEKSDLNITLNVPEDSLNSLNPEDILSRIITCSDSDVDITTLRELRTQILGELKQTGANDDISDLILKSYKTKKSRAVCKKEVEEGELSDSESEAIESIYGSLAVVDKNNIPTETIPEKDQSRKIQICLVINTKDSTENKEIVKDQKIFEASDFELFNESDSKVNITQIELCEKEKADNDTKNYEKKQTDNEEVVKQSEQINDKNKKDEDKHDVSDRNNEIFFQTTSNIKKSNGDDSEELNSVLNTACDENINDYKIGTDSNEVAKASSSQMETETTINTTQFKANFYKPLINDEINQIERSDNDPILITENLQNKEENVTLNKTDNASIKLTTQSKLIEDYGNALSGSKEKDLEIPLLNEPSVIKDVVPEDVVSQIDILQALKNEILNECLDIPDPEQNTPPLHQPKLVKVDSAQKITSNRISIEKYKEKISMLPHFVKDTLFMNMKDDSVKKQSIKLTEKECERFKFTSNIGLDDFDSSSGNEDEAKGNALDDLYGALNPKSPDLDVSNDVLKEPPKIIPAEPVKQFIASSNADVDMRTFIPTVSKDVNLCSVNSSATQEKVQKSPRKETKVDKRENNTDKSKLPLSDPRIRRDIKQPVNIEQSVSQSTIADRTQRPSNYSNIKSDIFTNITQNLTPSMASNVPQIITPLMTPLMTPTSRAYENTPTRQPFEFDNNNVPTKHVYAPSFPFFEGHKSSDNPKDYKAPWDFEIETKNRKTRWEDTEDSKQRAREDVNITQREKTLQNSRFNEPYKNDKGSVVNRYKIDRREENSRLDCPRTPVPSFGWADNSNSPVYNRLDSPMTPNNCFGRIECPMTPSHPFGRSDYIQSPHHLGRTDGPIIPNNSFGRIDCPATPNHPFGQSECPPTPSHPFGQSECPPTPSHPFGQSECPQTPIYSLGRNDFSFAPVQTFGRLEGSATPNRLFGQLDGSTTPSHTFGRTDYITKPKIFLKDPRLNKNLDKDQNCQYNNETNRQYYKDHIFNAESSNNSHKRPYDNYDKCYRNFDREQSIGRNDRSIRNSNEQSGRYWRQRESNSTEYGRNADGRYRDYDARFNDRYENRTLYREKEARYREKSIGRMVSSDENMKSTNRVQKIGRNYRSEANSDKTLSVKSDCGRSFTIDTNINSTFQDFIQRKGIQLPDCSFDAHRKRASSVGRSLIVRSSKTAIDKTKLNITCSRIVDNDKNIRFTRARSLGRDVSNLTKYKSFSEIKAEFQSYKTQFVSKQCKNYENNKITNLKSSPGNDKSNNWRHSEKKIETYKHRRSSQRGIREKYSSHNKDHSPRMQTDFAYKSKSDYKDRSVGDKKNYGIVYSNDNIAKGTILRSGYGVKNYKIPKIKRVVVESDEKDLNSDDKSIKDDKREDIEKNNIKETNKIKSSSEIELNKIDKDISKEILRFKDKKIKSELKSNDIKEDPKTRQVQDKEPLLRDKNLENEGKMNAKATKDEASVVLENVAESSQCSIIATKNTQNNADLNSDFGLDDLEVFSDNIISDPVIANINALIADLDNDIDTTKIDATDSWTSNVPTESVKSIETSENVESKSFKDSNKDTKENADKNSENINTENKIVVSVSSKIILTECNNDAKKDFDKNYENINKIEENEFMDLVSSEVILTENKNITTNTCPSKNEMTTNILSDAIRESDNDITYNTIIHDEENSEKSEVEPNLVSNNNEPIVSTTHIDIESSNVIEENKIISRIDEGSNDGASTPDSTINTNEDILIDTNHKTVPDSSNEAKSSIKSTITNEMNTDVTSTIISSDVNSKDNMELSSSCKLAPAIESIGSLLSMLQDKEKIKELLSMLGESTGKNEKIKKKLEKLSEIVSDDENTNDEEITNTKDLVENKSKDTAEISSPINNNSTESQLKDTSINSSQMTNETNQLIDVDTEIDTKQEYNTTNISGTSEMDSDDRNKRNVDTKSNEMIVDSSKSPEIFNEEIQTNTNAKIVDKLNLNKDVETNTNANNKNKLIENEDLETNTNAKHVDKLNESDKIKSDTEDFSNTEEIKEKNTPVTKKMVKRGKGKLMQTNKSIRITRTSLANMKNLKNTNEKKPSRELLQLQEDIKEMFLNDDILNTTGIRMCRLAKMVEKNVQKEDTPVLEPKPVVVLKKFKDAEKSDDTGIDKPLRKKPGPKPKMKVDQNVNIDEEPNTKVQITLKPKTPQNNKSKSILKQTNSDPYAFESDSLDMNILNESEDESEISSDSESVSLKSSLSYGSNELLAEVTKKPKRKRRNTSWQAGVIKTKNRKKKVQPDSPKDNEALSKPKADIVIPSVDCFTDKLYCFQANVSVYSCRLCEYSGNDIVYHYKQKHPHVEIPLSRMNPVISKEAIAQSEKIDYQLIDKIYTSKYVCRFCYKQFGKGKNVMETFFWHVVSMHTGEYKHNCSECEKPSNCPLNLDIPPPPKDINGHLIGYICKKCNFTQISIENLKRHVILRHSDEKTEVYKINIAVIPKKLLQTLTNQEIIENQRITRSSLSNRNSDDVTDEQSDLSDESDDNDEENALLKELLDEPSDRDNSFESKIKSKIMFEGDHPINKSPNVDKKPHIHRLKQEKKDDTFETGDEQYNLRDNLPELRETQNSPNVAGTAYSSTSDIVKSPHFKINYNSTGNKEYVCCINGHDNHYKTNLLISMKKHIQTKHNERWEGYCTLCKVIVTPQGTHSFKDCLQHMVDKHTEDFPLLETSTETVDKEIVADVDVAVANSSYDIASRLPQTETNSDLSVSIDTSTSYPKIENVVSFGISHVNTPPQLSPNYPVVKKHTQKEKQYKYEEWQTDVMSKKHRVVLETMITRDKLVKVFKCAGRFCSFTTDNAEEALHHASTHQRIGGQNALICAYCDFDTSGNAIDLVMHVFKVHGRCQYSCALCFYRGAAGQLVGAHIERIHREKPKVGSVLRAKNVSTVVTDDSANLLSRQDAVDFYYCAHGLVGDDRSNNCKYKTYIADKFSDHLQQYHQAPHPCTICLYKASDPIDLINHLKSHNINLYQCTWCVHGADNEIDLLGHASICHPTEQPNAYVRVITNKEHFSELRVLPMASLNKIKTPIDDVSSDKVDDPVREAERSLDLEKLIGDIENVTSTALGQSVQTSPPLEEIENIIEDSPEIASNENQTTVENVSSIDFVSSSSVRLPDAIDTNKINQEASVVPKVEPVEQKLTDDSDDVIYCSDSEEDESRLSIIDLSNDDIASEVNESSTNVPVNDKYVKVDLTSLNKCPKCNNICRTMVGLKKHLLACWTNLSNKYQCPHCPFPKTLTSIAHIEEHYSIDHREDSYVCGICKKYFTSMQCLKKHVKYSHKANNQSVKMSKGQQGNTVYSVHGVYNKPEEKLEKVSSKRKLSADTPKPRRYGPQDIDRLPITPILDELVYCSLCEFNTKVRVNLVRHLQLHAQQQPVPHSAPVNPVPHLETNEKHFDKMLNLASSSFASRSMEKSRTDSSATVSLVSPETASRYPKFVPDRQRYTCGSKDCAYISLTEDMLRCHWETLHSNTNEYYCVHCPPNQQFDRKRQLSASLIINHLKMHDTALYACNSCPYYHHKRSIVENHLAEVHKGGQVVVVRDDSANGTSQTPPTAPTMDLKPWQCGLCKYKSMLRPEVAEHCSKVHQSKMQYKCSYCPFRTSTLENVTKHQANSHPDNEQDVFYYYYREGSIPDDEDGTPRWLKQKQKTNTPDPEIKTEVLDSSIETPVVPAVVEPKKFVVDLNIVKQEVPDVFMETGEELSVSELCKKYGQFCEPNGLKYKCSLCKVVIEETEQAMRSHLFEELKYRRWCCGICSYKAFHKDGLKVHMASEHRRQSPEPVELPLNINIEKWVKKYLEHQTKLIKINKDKLSKQSLMVSKVTAGPSAHQRVTEPASPTKAIIYNKAALESAFGSFGTPSDMQYSCPKCDFKTTDEDTMKSHLENELSKIRWCCNICMSQHQSYHQAQFHCKIHQGQNARPIEALRDTNMRNAWVTGLIQFQKQSRNISVPSMHSVDESDPSDNENSLLVVRYEEKLPNPEENLANKRPMLEHDDTRYPNEQDHYKDGLKSCQYCDYTTKYSKSIKLHLYKHYDLKPFTCSACPTTGHQLTIVNHIKKMHPGELSIYPKPTKLPTISPSIYELQKKKKKTKAVAKPEVVNMVCLNCEKNIPIKEMRTHLHDSKVPEFAKSGEIVVKCCICLALRLELKSLQEHHNSSHPDIPINYSFYKLHSDTRDTHHCAYCKSHFRFLNDLKSHHNAMHGSQQLKYTTFSYLPGGSQQNASGKRKAEESMSPNPKRIAKKSTTKLPGIKAVARKSTTKLPGRVSTSEFDDWSDSDESDVEFSNYGKKPPSIENYANVTALMPFCGTTMRFTMQKLSEIIDFEPKLVVKDIKVEMFK